MEVVKPGHHFYKLLEYAIQIDSTYLLNLLFNYLESNYKIMPTCINSGLDDSIEFCAGAKLPAASHKNCHTLLLFKAVQFDAVNCIKYLISKGTNPNCFPTKIRFVQICEVFHYTPLHYAADIEMFNAAEMLLQNGIMPANPNISTKIAGVFKTPLMTALSRCNEKIADLLLKNNATPFYTRDVFDDLSVVVTANSAQPRKNMSEVVKQNIFAKIIGYENKKILGEFCPVLDNDEPKSYALHKSNHFSIFNYFASMATLRGDIIMARMIDEKFMNFMWINAEIVRITRVILTEQKNINSMLHWLPHDIVLIILGEITLDIILGLTSKQNSKKLPSSFPALSEGQYVDVNDYLGSDF